MTAIYLGAAMRDWILRLVKDRQGVAVVEFALIVPFLLIFYFLSMEVSQAIENNKKVSRIGSMVADLVAQNADVTPAELDAIMQIGSAVLQPYGRSAPRIAVTGIYLTDEATPKAQVVWSRKMANGVFSRAALKGTVTSVPTALKIRDTFIVRVESELDYRPVIAWSADGKAAMGLAAAFDNINMSETYYLRPRMSSDVQCASC
ncbi:TadE/TadG family type IV pilus assembly protein [Aerobium aerolatum]|uniref:Flp pilus assembly protein TadG n=1 Tax=Aquamicrobium aerolatum DSM 21857 TaxID=1121003 RepID=A0A1I3LHU1_9HYPH|nr:TadE/TadG family type IV pilus assembly protein [Aquamicrobium aerolatum]SFI83975.1 Flp pilus assembly protein TadG [Aquamicrobium aerolatum DSM 21857]